MPVTRHHRCCPTPTSARQYRRPAAQLRAPRAQETGLREWRLSQLDSERSCRQNLGMAVPTRTESVPPEPSVRRRHSRRLADNYLIAADAPAPWRPYTADWTHFSRWCQARGVKPMPASPSLAGEYLADLGEGYARATLRRKVAAIARVCRLADQPLDTRHPATRDVRRVINRTHGSPAKRAQALDIDDLQRLVATCEDSL